MLRSSRPTLTTRGMLSGSPPKMVGRPWVSAAGGDEPDRLVEQEQPRALLLRQRLAVDADAVARGHVERRRGNLRAVDRDPAGGDPGLRLPARGEPDPRHHLGDALGRLWRGRRRFRGHRARDRRFSAACRGICDRGADGPWGLGSYRPWGSSLRPALCRAATPLYTGHGAVIHGTCTGRGPGRARRRRGPGRLRDRARRPRDRSSRQPHPHRPRSDRPRRDGGDPRRPQPRSAPNG